MEGLVELIAGGAGWGLGLGAALGAAAVLRGGGRPLAKQVLKAGMTMGPRLQEMGTRLQEWGAKAQEELEDIVAEARAERRASQTPEAPAAPGE